MGQIPPKIPRIGIKNPAEFALMMQDRRARRSVEKNVPHLLPEYDALVKNGAAELMRAVYLGGLSDGALSAIDSKL